MKSPAILCQNRIRLGAKGPLYTRTTWATPLQAKAFSLIGVAIA